MFGPGERIYLQYKPDEAALSHLLTWQQQAHRVNPQARPVPRDKMHLTLLHFGIAQDMYREVTQQQPDLSWDSFAAAVRSFIDASQEVLPQIVTAKPTDFALFGHQSSVLAINLTPSPELLAAHQAALKHLQQCIKSLGIEYPAAFMQGSPNLRFGLTLRPHISLLRAARHRPRSLDKLQRPLRLHVLPVHYS